MAPGPAAKRPPHMRLPVLFRGSTPAKSLLDSPVFAAPGAFFCLSVIVSPISFSNNMIMQRKNAPSIAVLLSALLLAFPLSSLHAAPRDYLYGSMARFRLLERPAPLPDVDFLDADGRPLKLSQFRGHVVLLTTWATWCPYCRVELPTLNQINETLAPEGLVVLAVAVDKGGPPVVKRFLEAEGFRLPVIADPKSAVGLAFAMPGIPYSIVIDAEGRELGRIK